MNISKQYTSVTLKYTCRSLAFAAIVTFASLTACNQPQQKQHKRSTTKKEVRQASPDQTTVTLPLLDALFYESDFATSLKSQLGLSAEQVENLKNAAHNTVAELTEDGAVDATSAREATHAYREKISQIVGEEKAQQLLQFVNDRYSKGVEGLAPTKPNFVPSDTRIVVNAPAFRMDIFQDGKLMKTYKVGIGYPEFPLPTGMRRADTIIFNPTWTPPDEPWVKGKFAPGKKVAAGSEINPLGLIKIPIGMPSLIHGGKPSEKIGNFASHGCVGLTNAQVTDFVPLLAQLGGFSMSSDSIRLLLKNKTKTRSIKLQTRVPVDLRYETIVAENGILRIYRDVYERGTNTLENAKKVLAAYNINYDKLDEQEKGEINEALEEMNRDAKGQPIAADSLPPAKDRVPASKLSRAKKGKVTSRVKGQKEASVPIAALQGKGYPSPVDLNDGSSGHAKSQ